MKIAIILRSSDEPQGQTFCDINDENGKSIKIGDWTADGEFEQLTLDVLPPDHVAVPLAIYEQLTAGRVSDPDGRISEAIKATDLYLYCGADGAKWAEKFRETAIKLGYSDMYEGWLIGWFANAIECAEQVRHPPTDADNFETHAIGSQVEKFTGDYQLPGEVRGVLTTKAGKLRYVVEHDAGFLHIYGPQNIRAMPLGAERKDPAAIAFRNLKANE